LLPGIDDGPADWDQSLAMARTAAGDGIAAVIATPHQLGNYGHNRAETIHQLVAELQAVLDRCEIPLCVLPGADVRIEPEMIRKVLAGEVLTLGGRSRYLLLELPHELYVPLDGLLRELEQARLVGILSHPERNLGILGRQQLADSLVDAGCLMQVTAGSLIGTFGPQIQAAAERMLTRGLVHFLATDAHSPRSRRPLMRRAFDRAVELVGLDAARDLCCRNPARVVTDQQVPMGRRQVERTGLARWFSSRRAS
jgi:protein-tyrosine phosphatase